MPVSDAEISALLEAYSKAAQALDRMPPSVDRDVGYAALHLDAVDTLNWLTTRMAAGDTVAPFREWVRTFRDGDKVLRVVGSIDSAAKKQATKVMREVFAWALLNTTPTLLVGTCSFVGGIAVGLMDWGHDAGQNMAKALLAGAIPGVVLVYLAYVARSAGAAGQVVNRAVLAVWARASSLGDDAHSVFAKITAPVEHEVRSRHSGPSQLTASAFVRSVQVRAQGVVGFALGLAILGVLTLIYGVFTGIEEYVSCRALASTPYKSDANSSC